jgi:hypothetical protein
MNRQQFYDRLVKERTVFLTLCQEEGVWEVAGYAYKLAPAFAERLILDMTEAQARNSIRAARPAAAAFSELVADILAAHPTKDSLAARIPSDNLTPFYLLCSLVLDAWQQDRQLVQEECDDGKDSGGIAPSIL